MEVWGTFWSQVLTVFLIEDTAMQIRYKIWSWRNEDTNSSALWLLSVLMDELGHWWNTIQCELCQMLFGLDMVAIWVSFVCSNFLGLISLVLGGQQGSSMDVVLNSKPPVYLETLLLCKSPLNPLGWPGQDINKFVNHVQLDDEPFWILDGYYGVLCNIVT